MKRGDFRLRAAVDSTVDGPPLTALACGCVVDDIGGIWSPCPMVADVHARACGLARKGFEMTEAERKGPPRDWLRPRIVPVDKQGFESCLDTLRQHVANAKRYASSYAAAVEWRDRHPAVPS